MIDPLIEVAGLSVRLVRLVIDDDLNLYARPLLDISALARTRLRVLSRDLRRLLK